MGEHPFRRAWETRDVDGWAAALADDVVLHSPVISSPFAGRAAVRELYEVLFAAFGRVDIFAELTGGDARMFAWRGEIGGRVVEGADFVRADARGKIAEIRVFIRPLVDIGVFAGAAGPPLARRRGRLQALVLRALTLPLRGLLATVDVVAPRLAQRRG